MKVLITGGAGYIGSHVLLKLLAKSNDVFICDDLSTGHKDMLLGEAFTQANIVSMECETLFQENDFDAVMHFAAFCDVEESMSEPLKYYSNNTTTTQMLLELCKTYEVKNFIFSSTAAVYGMPEKSPVSENTPLLPINPYGNSKLACEMALADLAQAGDFRYVSLRYFNAAGADPDARIGERKEGHMIKNVCRAAAGLSEKVVLFGDDYETKDGTCVRDYIHVFDIANAHVLALEYLMDGGQSTVLNCGYGHGYSLRDIVDMTKRVADSDFTVEILGRRPGDPPELIANNSKIKQVLDWEPQYDSLEGIITDAYRWEKRFLSM